MSYNTTLRIKLQHFELATEWANKYNLSRSTIINIAISKLQKSKYLDRFIKQGITRNTTGQKIKTTWSTTKNLYNYCTILKKKYDCSLNDIVISALSYIYINAKKPKYLDYAFKRVIERNKNKYKRNYLL